MGEIFALLTSSSYLTLENILSEPIEPMYLIEDDQPDMEMV